MYEIQYCLCSKQCSSINSAAKLIHFKSRNTNILAIVTCCKKKHCMRCFSNIFDIAILVCETNKEFSIHIVKLYLPFGTIHTPSAFENIQYWQ